MNMNNDWDIKRKRASSEEFLAVVFDFLTSQSSRIRIKEHSESLHGLRRFPTFMDWIHQLKTIEDVMLEEFQTVSNSLASECQSLSREIAKYVLKNCNRS